MNIKNSNNLRKKYLVPKNKINTVQKRTISGHYTFTFSIAATTLSSILSYMCFIPLGIAITLKIGLPFDNLENAHSVASQVAENAQSMEGQTDGAGGDNMDVNSNNATGTGNDVLNSSNEQSQLVDHAESMPGLTATAGTAVYAGLAMGVANNAINSNAEQNQNQDDSEESDANSTRLGDFLNDLRNTLYHINRQRRVNMSLLRDATDVLRHRVNVLYGYTDVVLDSFPDMLDEYIDILNSLRNISNRSANSNYTRSNIILDQAQEQGIAPELVFEDIQNDLDVQAGNLENLIRRFDPDAEFSSDTDSEKINEAVQDHALRYPG